MKFLILFFLFNSAQTELADNEYDEYNYPDFEIIYIKRQHSARNKFHIKSYVQVPWEEDFANNFSEVYQKFKNNFDNYLKSISKSKIPLSANIFVDLKSVVQNLEDSCIAIFIVTTENLPIDERHLQSTSIFDKMFEDFTSIDFVKFANRNEIISTEEPTSLNDSDSCNDFCDGSGSDEINSILVSEAIDDFHPVINVTKTQQSDDNGELIRFQLITSRINSITI